MSNILVTGSAGFIGSALTLKLLERGDNIIGVDNLNDYYSIKLKEDRLARHINHKNYTHYQISIDDRQKIEKIFTYPILKNNSYHCFSAATICSLILSRTKMYVPLNDIKTIPRNDRRSGTSPKMK